MIIIKEEMATVLIIILVSKVKYYKNRNLALNSQSSINPSYFGPISQVNLFVVKYLVPKNTLL
jgi:hypothetical protein